MCQALCKILELYISKFIVLLNNYISGGCRRVEMSKDFFAWSVSTVLIQSAVSIWQFSFFVDAVYFLVELVVFQLCYSR